jgi:hypothetical protein
MAFNRSAFALVVGLSVLLANIHGVLADDVTVKTITPDKPPDPARPPGDPSKVSSTNPPASQPAPAVSGQPQPRTIQPWVHTGISRVDGALVAAGPSQDQVAKINAAVAPLAKQFQESTKPLQAEFFETIKAMTAFTVPGAKVSPEDRAKATKLQQEAQRSLYEAGEKVRPDFEAQFLPLLTEAQVAKYKDALEESADTPTGRAKFRARMDLHWYRAAGLTDQEQTKVRDILAKAYLEFDQAHPDYNDKIGQLWAEANKARADGKADAAKAADDQVGKLYKEYADSMKAARSRPSGP